MLFFIVIIFLLIVVFCFLVYILVPPPIRWILGPILDLLFLALGGWGIKRLLKRFKAFDLLKVSLRILFELAKIVLVLTLPSLILLIIFVFLR